MKFDNPKIVIELFPRNKKPYYPADTCVEYRKYITWETACLDIKEQKSRGFRGEKFIVYPRLVNKNKNKKRIIEKIWNQKFEQYVPDNWAKSSDCIVRKIKVPVKPKWKYLIVSIVPYYF